MARANRKAIDKSNFWDTRWIQGRLASGKPKINAGNIRRLHKAKKDRLRLERKRSNYFKHMKQLIFKPTKKAKHEQIQYGFDIANWWNEQHA